MSRPVPGFPVNRETMEIGFGRPHDLVPTNGPPVVFIRMKFKWAVEDGVVRDDERGQVSAVLTDEEVASLRAQLIEYELARLESEHSFANPPEHLRQKREDMSKKGTAYPYDPTEEGDGPVD